MKKLSFLIAPVAMACMAAFIQPAMAEPKSVADLKQQDGEKTPLNMNYQVVESDLKLMTDFKNGYSAGIAKPGLLASDHNCFPRKVAGDSNAKWCVLVGDDPEDGDIDNWSCYLTGMRGFGNDNDHNADAQIYRGANVKKDGTVVRHAVKSAAYYSDQQQRLVDTGKDMTFGLLPDGKTPAQNKIWLVVSGYPDWHGRLFTQVGWECVKFKSN